MAGLLPQDEMMMGLLGDPRQMAMLSAAAALLEGGGPSLTPTSFGQNLGRAAMTGMNAYQQGLQMKRQFERQAKDDARADARLELERQRFLQGGGDPAGWQEFQRFAGAAGLEPGTPEYQEAANIHLGRVGRASNAGYQFKEVKGADGRTRIAIMDPRTGGIIGYQDEQFVSPTEGESARNTAQGAAEGRATGEAIAQLPAAQLEVEKFSSQIDNLISHPGMSGVIGVPNLANLVPGTPESDFAAMLEQVQGGAFLQAMESLKGGGQISEIEGNKATQAIIRAQKAQSEDAFVSAMLEAKYWAQRGFEVAQKKAGVAASTPQQPVLRYNPETGTVE